jgi:hypothetical protein
MGAHQCGVRGKMIMLYLVSIGRKTRRGGFQELHSLPVRTAADYDEVESHYKNKYKGFDVFLRVFADTAIEEPATEPKTKSYLTDVPVMYTEEEQRLATLCFEKREEAADLEAQLRDDIKKRYESLEFTAIGCYEKQSFDLVVYEHEAFIKTLPIFGGAFIQHIGEGKEI